MKKIILSLFLVVSLTALSQRGYLDNYNNYGGYGFETTHILKTDLSQMFRANIALIYEYRFHEEYSVELGVGLLTHSFFRPVFQPRLSDPLYSELKGGYSLHLQPNFFANENSGLYIGLPLDYRRHGSQAESYEIGFGIGYQFNLTDRLTLNASFGCAFNVEITLDGESYIYHNFVSDLLNDKYMIRMLYPLSIKLGFML